MNKTIPESVIEEAKGLIEIYGNNLEYLGEYKGSGVYKFKFPKDSETGFPFVYMHDSTKDKVMEITGFDALDIIDEFVHE